MTTTMAALVETPIITKHLTITASPEELALNRMIEHAKKHGMVRGIFHSLNGTQHCTLGLIEVVA